MVVPSSLTGKLLCDMLDMRCRYTLLYNNTLWLYCVAGMAHGHMWSQLKKHIIIDDCKWSTLCIRFALLFAVLIYNRFLRRYTHCIFYHYTVVFSMPLEGFISHAASWQGCKWSTLCIRFALLFAVRIYNRFLRRYTHCIFYHYTVVFSMPLEGFISHAASWQGAMVLWVLESNFQFNA